MQSHANFSYWLGVIQLEDGSYVMDDNAVAAATYMQWAPGEPIGSGKCVVITQYGWRKAQCSDEHRYICKRSKNCYAADVGPNKKKSP